MMVKVIAITNQKGGTGKTTLSAILAYGLAKQGHKVLLIDLDPQAHLTSFFVKSTELDNYRGSIHMARGAEFKILPVSENIGLVPSNLRYILDSYRGELPVSDTYAIDKRIRREPAITRKYEYVICDTPPELFAPTIWALYAADYILIPTNFEELSLLGVRLLMRDVLPDVFPYRKNCKVLGVVLTNITKRYKKETIEKVGESIKRFIAREIPRSLWDRFYEKPLFDTVVYRYRELADLIYRPRRWETPLFRIMSRAKDLDGIAVRLAVEVLTRERNFKPFRQY